MCAVWAQHPMDCGPQGSSAHRIFQARILEWVAITYPGNLPDPGIEPASPASAGGFLTTSTTWEALYHMGTGFPHLFLAVDFIEYFAKHHGFKDIINCFFFFFFTVYILF